MAGAWCSLDLEVKMSKAKVTHRLIKCAAGVELHVDMTA